MLDSLQLPPHHHLFLSRGLTRLLKNFLNDKNRIIFDFQVKSKKSVILVQTGDRRKSSESHRCDESWIFLIDGIWSPTSCWIGRSPTHSNNGNSLDWWTLPACARMTYFDSVILNLFQDLPFHFSLSCSHSLRVRFTNPANRIDAMSRGLGGVAFPFSFVWQTWEFSYTFCYE